MNFKIETQGTPVIKGCHALKKHRDCVVFCVDISIKNCLYSLYSSSTHDFDGLQIFDDNLSSFTEVIFTDFPKSDGWQIICWSPAKRECYLCAIKD